MFILKKLVTPWLLPPGLLILLLVLAGIWFARNRDSRSSVVCLILSGLFWFTANGLTAHWLNSVLEADLKLPEKVDADVIIMLGADAHAKVPDFSGLGAPGPETMDRLVTAARLHRRTHLPIIVSGGKVYRHSAGVGLLARRTLMDLGIAQDLILVEDRSRDTRENARFSAEICRREGFTHPLLVTSGNHMKRSLLAFEAVGLPATPYPCCLKTSPDQHLTAWSALPSAQALHTTAAALHEMLGYVYYRWYK